MTKCSADVQSLGSHARIERGSSPDPCMDRKQALDDGAPRVALAPQFLTL